jgi:hypothetical protein
MVVTAILCIVSILNYECSTEYFHTNSFTHSFHSFLECLLCVMPYDKHEEHIKN